MNLSDLSTQMWLYRFNFLIIILKNLLQILIISFFVSCNNENDIQQNSTTEIDDSSKVTTTTKTDVLKFFERIYSDTTKIEIKDEWENYSLPKEKLIPIIYQDYFKIIQEFDWTNSTTLLPVGYLKLKKNNFLLIVAEQYDYGVRCYGLIYEGSSNKIKEKTILAQTFGDAEASEEIWSSILSSPKFEIIKHKRTCIAELDFEKDPIELISEECKDSIFKIEINDTPRFILK